MSDNIVVKVNCHHSGQFKKENGELTYEDGVVDVVEVDSITLFEHVVLKMLEKKICIGKMWYKLPFEEVSDRRPLWEVNDANKRKLRSAGRWMREVDIFFEKYDVEEEDDPPYKADGDCSENESKGSEAGLSESEELDDEAEIIDEDEVYPASDDSSSDEEIHAERLDRRNLPDSVFSLRQLFCSGKKFNQSVIKYILKTRRNVVFDRWEKTKLGARCAEKGCGWSIYCSVENPIRKWMVKRYEDEHQCHPVGRCKLIKSHVIADIFLEDIRRDPQMSAPEIKDEMKIRYNIIITPTQSKTARRLAFDKLQAECDEQFARLRDYELQLTGSNDGTTIEINTNRTKAGEEAFSQMYICFGALKSSWKQNCRPIIGLDGTFLKHYMKGMMLTAIGRVPNNQIYPIAWGVVSAENNDNWESFIHKLKVDLDLGAGEGVSIISDMHISLIHGVATELPRAEHRACARHIYSNLKKNHNSDILKPLFWRVASSYNKADFKANLNTFREFDPAACYELLKKDPATWCMAFFRIESCCADTHNNHTESFNRTLKTARKKPFVQMLELIRRDAMQRIANRSNTAGKEAARYTKKARKELEKSIEEARHCSMIHSTGGRYEIVESVCEIRENALQVEDYVSHFYLTSKWQETYMRGLRPVDGPKFWEDSGRGRIVGPPYKRPPGIPKGRARIKGVHESPSKKKVGRKGRESHCGLCGEKGHNSRKCPHESQESRAKRRRLYEEVEAQAHLDVEDVSSTAPQPSQLELEN